MNKKFLTVLILPLLASCGNSSQVPPEAEKYYALFMYNYPRATETAPSGNDEKIDNLLYYKEEIQLGQTFAKPATDPTREKYEFQGWYKEKSCDTQWNFTTDTASSSVYLYAKWGVSEEEEFVEPEYTYPETIITDADYRVTGILNAPINNGQVSLYIGAIKRLENSQENVSFAINYERKQSVSLKSATYNPETKVVHIEFTTGDPVEVHVNQKIKALDNSYYETKAQNYENNGANIENYHIALMGSSSMENWATSKEDMSPIVTFNHGIGGTTAEEWGDSLLERLVTPYSPKAVVYYVGVNDIINKRKSGTYTAQKLEVLFNKTHELLPKTQIFYVLINKLPSYLAFQPEFDIANNFAKSYAAEHSYLRCIDAGKDLLKPNGNPSFAYFVSDGLHMSKYGYVIWGKAVKNAVIEWLSGK